MSFLGARTGNKCRGNEQLELTSACVLLAQWVKKTTIKNVSGSVRCDAVLIVLKMTGTGHNNRSVADPGCLSRILIFTHAGCQIPDPKMVIKARGKKKFVVIPVPFFVATNFTKCKLFYFEMLKKKMWANVKIIIELFNQKIVTKISKIRGWDPGSATLDNSNTRRRA